MKRTPLNIKLLIPCIAVLLGSCNEKQEDTVRTYFGGEIINPRADYVILTKNNTVVDTIQLDRNNFFTYEFESVEPGLYRFSHREYQLIHVEPGDSIMIRVNTVEFDESLAFSGRGFEKNNFLIDMFLRNEREETAMSKFYQKDPEAFSVSLDSMRDARQNLLNKLNSKYATTALFNEIAQANIDFDYFTKKEIYPFAHYGSNHLENMTSLPDDFYDYRQTIDFGNKHLYSYYPYYTYLSFFTDNLAYTSYMNQAKFDRTSRLHTQIKINLIDSIITHDSLKNNLLFDAAERFILHSKDSTYNKEIANIVNTKNNNSDHHDDLDKLLNTCNKMVPGSPIPNQVLATAGSTLKDLHSVIKRPTVLFFWSTNLSSHNKRIHKKAAELREKFPEFDFLGICVSNNHDKWLNIIDKLEYKPNLDYRFNDPETAKLQLVLKILNKAIIVDQNSVILENNSNIFSSVFESELLGMLNQ